MLNYLKVNLKYTKKNVLTKVTALAMIIEMLSSIIP